MWLTWAWLSLTLELVMLTKVKTWDGITDFWDLACFLKVSLTGPNVGNRCTLTRSRWSRIIIICWLYSILNVFSWYIFKNLWPRHVHGLSPFGSPSCDYWRTLESEGHCRTPAVIQLCVWSDVWYLLLDHGSRTSKATQTIDPQRFNLIPLAGCVNDSSSKASLSADMRDFR